MGGIWDPETDFDGRSGALIPAKSRDHVDWMVIRPVQNALVLLHVVCYKPWVQKGFGEKKNKS